MGSSGSSHGARAAVDLGHAVGVFTDQLALGLGAGGFVAFPVALGFLTHRLALRFGCLAVSDAMGLLAHSHTFRAV